MTRSHPALSPHHRSMAARSATSAICAISAGAAGVAVAVVALIAGGTGASAQAVPADAFFRGFEPNGDFLLTIAGKEEPRAEILQSASARSFLIISSELPSPILVNVPGGVVETVQLMKVARQPDGTVDLLADATLDSAGKYQVLGGNIEFRLDGKTLQLKQRPYVLGLQTGTGLLASSPSYQKTAKSYAPDAGILKRLKEQREPVRVLTFFGTWCPHCKRHLPFLLKVEQGLAGSKFQFDYYGLPRPFDGEPEAKKYDVDGVPTAILFVGGKEIGRIPASQWSNPEVALDLQLNGPGRSKTR